MGLFTRDKQDLSKIYELIMQITTDLHTLKSKLQIMETNQASMRGLINRKLGKGTIKDDDEDNNVTPPTLAEIQQALMGVGNAKE